MGGVNLLIKCSLFIFNFIFWLCGTLILGVTIWIMRGINMKEMVGKEASSNPNVGLSILMGVGATIMILGFLGCCGAITENRFVLFVFFISLFVLLIMQVTAGTLSIAFRSQIDLIFSETMAKNINLLQSTDKNAKHFQEILIAYQETFKCCGLINGAVDWGNNFADNHKSCYCINERDDCVNYGGRSVYRQTCIGFFKHTIKDNLNIVIGLAFGMALIEIFGMMFAMIMICQIPPKN